MFGKWLDEFARSYASGKVSRRGMLGSLAGGVGGGSLAGVGLHGTAAQGACPREQPIRCGDACVDLRTDPNNCGRCGTTCAGVCYAGRCLSSCPRGFDACGGTCLRSCPAGQEYDGSCACQCSDDQLDLCNGVCRDIQNDPNNCGACGNFCPGGECNDGTCCIESEAAGCSSNSDCCGNIFCDLPDGICKDNC